MATTALLTKQQRPQAQPKGRDVDACNHSVSTLKRISHCPCVGVCQLNLKVSLLVGRIKSGGGVKETRPRLGAHATDGVKVKITLAEEDSLFNLHTYSFD